MDLNDTNSTDNNNNDNVQQDKPNLKEQEID